LAASSSASEDLLLAQGVVQRVDHLLPKTGQLRTDRNVTTTAHTARAGGSWLEHVEPGKADQVAQSAEFLGREDVWMFQICADECRLHVLQRQDRVACRQADVFC
jgi:hypothetical protein